MSEPYTPEIDSMPYALQTKVDDALEALFGSIPDDERDQAIYWAQLHCEAALEARRPEVSGAPPAVVRRTAHDGMS